MENKRLFKEHLKRAESSPGQEVSLNPEEVKSYQIAEEALNIPRTREYHLSHHAASYPRAAHLQEGAASQRKIYLMKEDNERVLGLENNPKIIRELAERQGISEEEFMNNLRKVGRRYREMLGESRE